VRCDAGEYGLSWSATKRKPENLTQFMWYKEAGSACILNDVMQLKLSG
jgi:hypothetical protein